MNKEDLQVEIDMLYDNLKVISQKSKKFLSNKKKIHSEYILVYNKLKDKLHEMEKLDQKVSKKYKKSVKKWGKVGQKYRKIIKKKDGLQSKSIKNTKNIGE
jgi:superfamily II RNA helicase